MQRTGPQAKYAYIRSLYRLLPGDFSTPFDEDLGLVGHECKQVCTQSLKFTFSFADHSCSLLDKSFYPWIHDPDEDQYSRRMAISKGFG